MDSATLAQISLDNLAKFSFPDTNSTRISKPDISEITLVNDQDYLEIIFPARGLSRNSLTQLLMILCLGSNYYGSPRLSMVIY